MSRLGMAGFVCGLRIMLGRMMRVVGLMLRGWDDEHEREQVHDSGRQYPIPYRESGAGVRLFAPSHDWPGWSASLRRCCSV